MSQIHESARRGFSTEAESYARGRPEYPGVLAAWLADELGAAPGRRVVDVGAGTGKFTKLLVGSGATVLAVEPVEAMRQQLMRSLPGVAARDGTAEAMPVETGTADAITCAQAFHWFASEAALAEVHRVLRPGGRLGLVWNVRDESVDWVARLTEIITPYEGDAPRFHTGDWRRAFAVSRYFELPPPSRFVHEHVGTPQEVIVDRFLSVSFIAALSPQRKADVERQLRELIATHPALRGRDRLAFPYVTEAYCCLRLA